MASGLWHIELYKIPDDLLDFVKGLDGAFSNYLWLYFLCSDRTLSYNQTISLAICILSVLGLIILTFTLREESLFMSDTINKQQCLRVRFSQCSQFVNKT